MLETIKEQLFRQSHLEPTLCRRCRHRHLKERLEVWVKKHPWVKPLWAKDDSGQTVLQKVFCSCCQQAEEQRLLSGEAKRKSTYTTIGFTDWHNATDRFTKHEGSSTHRTALTRVKPGCMDPIAMVSSAKRREMEEARAALHQIFAAIQYLAGQGLAFRRKEEDVGNFSYLLDLLQETSPELRRFRALRSANNYTSPDIQNEILSILGNAVSREVMTEVQSAPFFAIIMDETADVSRREQVSICFRFVVALRSADDLEVHEVFAGLYGATDTRASTLARIAEDVMLRLQLDTSRLRGQCYDSAANMGGEHRGQCM